MKMSNQEAIEILREKISPCVGGEWKKSVDMAISALQSQDVPDTNVGDTVSRQAAINALCRRCDLAAEDDEPCTEKCNDIKILEKLPSAHPEIVRCDKCKHGVHSGRGNVYICHISPELVMEHTGDFYCGYAERKTDD